MARAADDRPARVGPGQRPRDATAGHPNVLRSGDPQAWWRQPHGCCTSRRTSSRQAPPAHRADAPHRRPSVARGRRPRGTLVRHAGRQDALGPRHPAAVRGRVGPAASGTLRPLRPALAVRPGRRLPAVPGRAAGHHFAGQRGSHAVPRPSGRRQPAGHAGAAGAGKPKAHVCFEETPVPPGRTQAGVAQKSAISRARSCAPECPVRASACLLNSPSWPRRRCDLTLRTWCSTVCPISTAVAVSPSAR